MNINLIKVNSKDCPCLIHVDVFIINKLKDICAKVKCFIYSVLWSGLRAKNNVDVLKKLVTAKTFSGKELFHIIVEKMLRANNFH